MHSLSVFVVIAGWLGLATAATAQGGGGQPITIAGDALLEVVQTRFGETNPVRLRVELNLVISGDKVAGGISRSVMSKKDVNHVVHSDHAPFTTQLGQPGETKSLPGYAVAVMSGNTLTLLQALKTGAIRVTIRMGSGCGMRIDHAREVGKGNTQSKGIHGEDIEITGWRQVSSSCRLTRG
jgi:hypothetical protein